MTVFMPGPELLESPRGRDLTWGHQPRSVGRTDKLPQRVDVAVVGGGLAAIVLAATLWHAGVQDVVIIDRDGQLGGRFLRRADILGQRVLRSPYDHHPGAEGYRDCELLDFARLHWSALTMLEKREVRMAQAGHRSVVPLDLFEAYCDHVVSVHALDRRVWRAEVGEVLPGPAEVVVRTSLGDVTAQTAVLCTGEERTEAPSSWFSGHRDHVYYWDQEIPTTSVPTVVVGAGLSGAHLVANSLASNCQVHWIVRKPSERYQCADVNASFFRAEGRARFHGTSWKDRLEMMRQQRVASVMFEFQPLLHEAETRGSLVVHRGNEVVGICESSVQLSDGSVVAGDRVVLALGTRPNVGSELMSPELVGLQDGWPDLDEATLAYRAAPRVHVLGAAACMALGPAARNIDGHRVGASRIADSILHYLANSHDRSEPAHA